MTNANDYSDAFLTDLNYLWVGLQVVMHQPAGWIALVIITGFAYWSVTTTRKGSKS